jgi:caffeoyl-CoA O-methyltransferase
MSEKRTTVTPELERALTAYLGRIDPFLARIQQDIHTRGKYPMQISFEQAVLHQWLCRLVGARRVLEVGTYLGFSAAAFALALPLDGHVDTVEIEPEHADIAEAWCREGGIADRVTVHRGAGTEVVATLSGPYDVCFLDGAKKDNVALLELCAGGLVLVDNVFADGAVTQPDTEDGRHALDALVFARNSPAYDPVVLPVADGLLVCRRV